jgi:hypothetical protein
VNDLWRAVSGLDFGACPVAHCPRVSRFNAGIFRLSRAVNGLARSWPRETSRSIRLSLPLALTKMRNDLDGAAAGCSCVVQGGEL